MPAVPSQLISISSPQASQPERRVLSELLSASSAPPPRVQQVWSVDIRVDRPILEAAIYTVVASPSIQSEFGESISAPPNDRASAPGIMPIQQRVRTRATVVSDGIDIAYDPFTGAFMIDARGDYDIEEEDAALLKRILRRLGTRRGGFFHLPGYGLDIKLKKLLRTTDRAKLRNEIIRQVRQEDEVTDVSVVVTTVLSRGILEIAITATTTRQTTLSFKLQVPEEGPITVA